VEAPTIRSARRYCAFTLEWTYTFAKGKHRTNIARKEEVTLKGDLYQE
jgi:hypothetical protein